MNYSKISLYLIGAGLAFALAGCTLFGDDDKNSPSPVKPLPTVSTCGDVTTAQAKIGDSLVAEANKLMGDEIQTMADNADTGGWEGVKGSGPKKALALYNEALAKAPGHCAAVFGKAVASAMMVVDDPKLNDFMNKIDSGDGSQVVAKRAYSLFKASPKEGMMAVYKTQARMETYRGPTVVDMQNFLETTVLPRIDSSIAYLETVFKQNSFSFKIEQDNGNFVELDKGEIGPMLAGAKVVKAWVIAAIAHDMSDIVVNGTYDWTEPLDNLGDSDAEWDNLSTAQKSALDRIVGLTKKGSKFTSIKAAWQADYQNIPNLLLSAIGNVQDALRFGLSETKASQENDPYSIGSFENADLDPTDVNKAINDLEQVKKYLTGPVEISYANGSKKFNIDIRKVFQRTQGLQAFLPYHEILPYEEWNDIVSADTQWSLINQYFPSEMRSEIIADMGLDKQDWSIGLKVEDDIIIMTAYSFFQVIDSSTGLVMYTSGFEDTIAVLSLASVSSPCRFSYTQGATRELVNGEYSTIMLPEQKNGSIVVSTCKINNGYMYGVDYTDIMTKGPFEFTDQNGLTTLTIPHMDNIDGPLDLKNKVIFPDPTFGGVFPSFTNANIWDYVASLDQIEPAEVSYQCRDEFTNELLPVSDYRNGIKCEVIMPNRNLSDLDRLIYWGARIETLGN